MAFNNLLYVWCHTYVIWPLFLTEVPYIFSVAGQNGNCILDLAQYGYTQSYKQTDIFYCTINSA